MKVGLEMVVSEFAGTVMKDTDYSHLDAVIPESLRATFKLPKESIRFKDNDAAEILAERVARKALERAELEPADIDYIIANNCGGKYCVPMVGSYVHWKLGFAVETPVLHLSQACASFVDACEVAWNLLLAGKYKRILVVAVSAWETKGGQARADLTDPMSAAMGDGAKANLTLSDLDMVVFHQPADMLYEPWIDGAAKAGLSKDKWKHTWHKYGNVANAVVPVNLAEFWEEGGLKKDSIIALITIGAGGHAPTMIIKWLV